MQTLNVTPNEAGQRLDKLLAKYLNQAGKGFLYKMMRKKNITLNGKKCDGSERLSEGDEIRLFLSDETIEKFSGKKAEIPNPGYYPKPDIIYEDSHILVVNKPTGLLSQKAKEGDESLNEIILNYLIDSGRMPVAQLRTFRPSICNRLDRNTSGLVVAGRSLAGLQVMNAVFKDRSIHKYYQCIVKGRIKERQLIAGFLRKDEEKNTVTIYPLEVEDSVPIMTEYLPLAWGDGHAASGDSHHRQKPSDSRASGLHRPPHRGGLQVRGPVSQRGTKEAVRAALPAPAFLEVSDAGGFGRSLRLPGRERVLCAPAEGLYPGVGG